MIVLHDTGVTTAIHDTGVTTAIHDTSVTTAIHDTGVTTAIHDTGVTTATHDTGVPQQVYVPSVKLMILRLYRPLFMIVKTGQYPGTTLYGSVSMIK